MSGANPSQQAQYPKTAQAAAAASGDQSFVQIQGETKKRKRSSGDNGRRDSMDRNSQNSSTPALSPDQQKSYRDHRLCQIMLAIKL